MPWVTQENDQCSLGVKLHFWDATLWGARTLRTIMRPTPRPIARVSSHGLPQATFLRQSTSTSAQISREQCRARPPEEFQGHSWSGSWRTTTTAFHFCAGRSKPQSAGTRSQAPLRNQMSAEKFFEMAATSGGMVSAWPTNADVILKRKILAQAGAKRCLAVRHNHRGIVPLPSRAAGFVLLHGLESASHRSPRFLLYARTVLIDETPTPRRAGRLETAYHAARQSTWTSASAPTTSAGSDMVKSTAEPTGTAVHVKQHAFAEIMSSPPRCRPATDLNATGA